VALDTCELVLKVKDTPLQVDDKKTYFMREMQYSDQGSISSDYSIVSLEKAGNISIANLEENMLDNIDLIDNSGQPWVGKILEMNEGNITYSLKVGETEALPYTFVDGKITIRLLDGLINHIELVPGSNTKDGITVCQYLASESCETGEQIRLNYPNLYQ
jgi:hypothetical protein